MEVIKTIGEVLVYVALWILGLYVWGTIRSGVFGYRSYSPRRKKRK